MFSLGGDLLKNEFNTHLFLYVLKNQILMWFWFGKDGWKSRNIRGKSTKFPHISGNLQPCFLGGVVDSLFFSFQRWWTWADGVGIFPGESQLSSDMDFIAIEKVEEGMCWLGPVIGVLKLQCLQSIFSKVWVVWGKWTKNAEKCSP